MVGRRSGEAVPSEGQREVTTVKKLRYAYVCHFGFTGEEISI